ncbi:Xylose isomerase domain-containing protein TIM barrel [Desulfovibrio sp. X2]|uniref:sugar phosphate isomerase/epimerase family protein n=1 Tax=Desulfovibrio sp. X2 TaxID=941449 RepID=UPI000358A4C7|nr:TIM barrel protein [Desulfovibrio sp. X2]EPR37626.1 Xylose isomerase domain-containing protein TIM barrel [Desulfovibrio sp. X2]
MRLCFVNLPLRYAERHPEYLEHFLAHGLCPELGIDAYAVDRLGRDWHERVAERLRAAGLAAAVHLPFDDLRPASTDPLAANAARRRILGALDVARIYGPRHMVGHPGLTEPNLPEQEDEQRASALATWNAVCDAWPGHPPLFLENTFDKTPDRLAALVAALRAAGRDVGVCFDAGHWHSFSRGSANRDLDRWFAALGPHIRHLHLHDNSGAADEHLGLGQGAIPWEQYLGLLAALPERPTATLEPHTAEALDHSLAFLRQHAERLASLIRGVD